MSFLCCFARSKPQHSSHQPTPTPTPRNPDALPRYTPQATSTHEKTLEFQHPPSYPDEKRPHEYPHDEACATDDDDGSSAFSFPSSYGNTSTATRDTPPPPYSPRAWSPASERRVSVSSSLRSEIGLVARPRPVYCRDGSWGRG